MNRQIRQVAFLVLVMFTALSLSVTSVQGLARPAIWEPLSSNGALNSDGRNSRTVNREFGTDRGPILLADKTTIVSTEKSDDGQGSEDYQRVYANGPLYAPVTGYFSPAFASMTGLEREANSVLNGDDPSLFSSRIKTLVTGGSQKGGAVELTINPEIQQAAYEALGNREGAVVALDPSTGAILAMVSSPSYDPNQFASHDANAVTEISTTLSEDSSRPLDNRAIAGNRYPPGSTFKIITTAAALRTGKITPDQEVDAPDTITLPGTSHSLENYGGESCGNGRTSFSHAFAESCNTPFAQLAMDVGEEELAEEAHNWGFDSKLSIPLTVTPSTYPDNDSQAQTAMAGIGQASVQATPMMMAMVAATVANNGEQMTPYLVSRTLDPDLNEVDTTSKKVARTPIDPATAKSLSSLMQTAVTDGTGNTAQVAGVQVAGKTGTAETGSDTGPTTWFVGFAGTDINKPQIALAVVLDGNAETEDNATGGKVAGPIAAQVIDAAVDQ
ncbi:penicillin-binding protein 2 [Actinomyces johnsonii]|uniref:Penicillin-binding protein 2 n=3 Tax=Actinomyces johnsonii TaxID=544581 RepID=A0A508A1A1_9ACTO|nr:penicillin-binding protein 2 [Actinomyces johnsonii]ERH20857.1 putative penicillin-binding protein A [Actinomyces johnsonii F0510]ERH21291.1 putative penicillin-binding protein A [Actinomyces johnsonii F0542]KAA8740303.1 penicillin-binding protein 2 [Actinomyces johnsonii]TQD42493.1 penicillin-binding protein 2 [Actinomyces johnsonii]